MYIWNKSSTILTITVIQLFVSFQFQFYLTVYMAQWCCYSQLHVDVNLTKTYNAIYSCLFLN